MKYKEAQQETKRLLKVQPLIKGYKYNIMPNRNQRRLAKSDIPFDNVQTFIKILKG